MAWEILTFPDGIIEVITRGELDYYTFKLQVMHSLAAAKNINSYLLLINHHDAQFNIGTFDSFESHKFFNSFKTPTIIRTAIVLPVSKYNEENYKFLETVSTNRGNVLKLFEDRESALMWLNKFIQK